MVGVRLGGEMENSWDPCVEVSSRDGTVALAIRSSPLALDVIMQVDLDGRILRLRMVLEAGQARHAA